MICRSPGIGYALKTFVAAAVLAAALLALVASAAFALPAGRSYQMVSAPDKAGDGVGAGMFNAGGRSSHDGNSFLYAVPTGFGDAKYSGLYNAVLATREAARWESESQTPFQQPIFAGATGPDLVASSPDLTKQLWETTTDPNTGVGREDRFSVWLHDSVAGTWEEITPDPLPGGMGYPSAVSEPVKYTGILPDLSVVMFETAAELTPEAVPLEDGDFKLYRWEDGNLTFEGMAPPAGQTGPGGEEAVPASLGSPTTAELLVRPISEDGEVAYFSRTTGNRALYRRDDSGTYLVNQDENPNQTIEPGEVRFLGANVDGSRAFFISEQDLISDQASLSYSLFMYEHGPDPAAEQNLTEISLDNEPADDGEGPGDLPDDALGVLGVSDDGHRVYFAHGSQLVPGAPLGSRENMYLWDDTSGTPVIKFIAALEATGEGGSSQPHSGMWNNDGGSERRAITPEGRYLFFTTWSGGLTPEPPTPGLQGFRYDAEASTPVEPSLVCVSCGPDGGGSTSIRTRSQTNIFGFDLQPQRWSSIDGKRVAFDTDSPLLPGDTNGRSDVYLWEEGSGLQLGTTGRSDSDSFLLDSDLSLDNVFVQTKEPLSGWDIDKARDVYAVTTDGPLPEPPPPPAQCQGEGCQQPWAGAPAVPVTGTSAYRGPGNQKQANRHKNKRRCGKHRHKKRTQKRERSGQQRLAARGCRKGR